MKTVYYLLLIFGGTLPWIAGLNLDKIIKTAQCQSACLRNLTTDDKCWNVGRSKNIQCEKVKTRYNSAFVLCAKSFNEFAMYFRHENDDACDNRLSENLKKIHTCNVSYF